jgi:hypothetical protein
VVAGPTAGPRTLRLRGRASVVDLSTDTPMCADADRFTVTLKPWEARIFGLYAH